MYQLRKDIIIYVTTFLQYTNSFGPRGLITTNKYINNILKYTPICIIRKINIQNLIIKSCIYHKSKNQHIIALFDTANKKKRKLESILVAK